MVVRSPSALAAALRHPLAVRRLGERRLAAGAAGLAAWLTLAGTGSANGGYFPSTWGWTAVGFLWVAAIVLLVSPNVELGSLELALLAALGLLAGLTALSAAWSASPWRAVLEVERLLVYVSGALAVLVASRRLPPAALLGGALAGIGSVCGYGLATRLFPERLGTFDPVAVYRLSEPVGYWNGLGVLAAIGVPLAATFAVRGRSGPGRALAGASLLVLVPALYFTFSRGAWIALALALATAIALDPRRLSLLAAIGALALAPALGVWVAAGSGALTSRGAPLAAAAKEGHRLALVLLALAVVQGAVVVLLAAAERRLAPGPGLRRAFAVGLVGLVAAAAVALLVRFGGPDGLAGRAYDAFRAPPPQVETDLNDRLLSFSGNGRADLWHVAWSSFLDRPLAGTGAGTYELAWLRERSTDLKVRDAHSLYLETAGELGLAGLALLLGALVPPLVAAARARSVPLVPAAGGGYVAYLVHAAADWDWELPAVTLAALLCGAVSLAAARAPAAQAGRRLRLALLSVALLLLPFAALAGLGASALGASADAAGRGDWQLAADRARTAERLAPWSPEPLRALGQAQLAEGQVEAARQSFAAAVAKAPGEWELWLDLARASEGEPRAAALARAAALNPRSPEVALFRAELEAEP